MYEFLVAVGILFVLWLVLFIYKKNLRKVMLFSGFLYALLLIPIFWIHKALSYFKEVHLYNPDYWTPSTLFNLNNITSGFSIEDVLFMIFLGGIVSILYELIFKKKISKTSKYKPSYLPIIGFVISYFIVLYFFKIPPIYFLVIPPIVGTFIIFIQRKDLIKNSIYSALFSTIIYFIGFIIFNLIFPNFIQTTYNLNTLSNIFILTVPIEELFYGFSFGLMWGPIYKVVKGLKNV